MSALPTAFAVDAEWLGWTAENGGLGLDWPELEGVLPDGTLPRGVIEMAAPHALGGATTLALAAVRAAQRRDAKAWAAWVDPEATLYAPGVAAAGVDLARLLVVRPPRADLPRVAVKLAAARAFDVLVIDGHALGGAENGSRKRSRKKAWPMEVLVRKLALHAHEGGASVLLLSDLLAPRALPWPVTMRLETTRREDDALSIRVAKDRRGRTGLAKAVPLRAGAVLKETA